MPGTRPRTLVYEMEKNLKEWGEKVGSDRRARRSSPRWRVVKESLTSESPGPIKRAVEALQKELHELAAEMYKQVGRTRAGRGRRAGQSGRGPSRGGARRRPGRRRLRGRRRGQGKDELGEGMMDDRVEVDMGDLFERFVASSRYGAMIYHG